MTEPPNPTIEQMALAITQILTERRAPKDLTNLLKQLESLSNEETLQFLPILRVRATDLQDEEIEGRFRF